MRFYRKSKRLFAMQIYKENKAKNRNLLMAETLHLQILTIKNFSPLYIFSALAKNKFVITKR